MEVPPQAVEIGGKAATVGRTVTIYRESSANLLAFHSSISKFGTHVLL